MTELTKLEVGLGLVLILVLILGGFGIYEHYHLINEGIARQKAADEGAVKVHDQDVGRQHDKDLKDKDDVITSLQKKLDDFSKLPAPNTPPAKPVRLCLDTHGSDQGRPAGSVPRTTAQPAKPTDSGVDSSLRGSNGAGPDIGPAMRDIALAGAILAEYHAACVEWALKQAQPLPPK